MHHELARVREWAQSKLDDSEEPSWAKNRYQHMIVLLDQMLGRRVPPAFPQGENVVPINRARSRPSRSYCGSDR
jgi:hypothetical protein